MSKTRLNRVAPADLPQPMQQAWSRSKARRGDATFIEAFGNAPEIFDWYAEFYRTLFYGGRVAVRTKELLRYRLSTQHGCRHCNLGNRLDAQDAGLSDAELDAVESNQLATLSAQDRATLAFADRMALTSPNGYVDAALHTELREYFDDAAIVELGVVAAVLTGMAKFLFAYDLVEREASCPIGRDNSA